MFALSLNDKSSIWPIDRTLSGASTPVQSGTGRDGNEGVLHILPKLQHYWSLTIRLFNIIIRILVGGGEGSYPASEMQSVYSTAPADRTVV